MHTDRYAHSPAPRDPGTSVHTSTLTSGGAVAEEALIGSGRGLGRSAGVEASPGRAAAVVFCRGCGLLKTPSAVCPHRPVCGVAGIPSSQSSAQHHMQHAASAAALPHCSHTGGTGSALAYRTQMDTSPAILMPSSLQTPQTQEQNGILDWLRKLRLHKYYPVFKQLTMEKVCCFLSRCKELACFLRNLSPNLAPRGTELGF